MPTATFSCGQQIISTWSATRLTSESCSPRYDEPGLRLTYRMPSAATTSAMTSEPHAGRVGVVVRVPQEVVDDDQVALAPRMGLADLRLGAHERVAVALEHVQPGLARVAVDGLAAPGADLEHHHGHARGLVADGPVEHEGGAGAARGVQQLQVVPARVEPAGAAPALLVGEPPPAARQRVVALDA